MNSTGSSDPPGSQFAWPADESECARVGRALLLEEAVSHVHYWTDYARDFLSEPQPKEPHRRSWSDVAKKDKAYREMFATRGMALAKTCLTFISGKAHESGIGERYELKRQLVPVHSIRSLKKQDLIHNSWQPKITVDPETYEVTADGELLTCEPAKVLPMAQRYFLF